MNVLIDINHPAHVHYFKNLYWSMTEDGHKVIVVSRNKEMEHKLLQQYGIEFVSRGKGAADLIGKIFNYFYAVIFLMNQIKKHRIDLVISFMHPYGAQAAWLMRKKAILFSDTEHATLHHRLSVPFATEIHTPTSFEKDLGIKHYRFNSFMELSYLHPDTFTPDKTVLNKLYPLIDKKKPITIIRFVSWCAVHDSTDTGLSNDDKFELVNHLSKISNVFISSENELPDKLKKYELNIDKTEIHSLLFYADLFVGESATMASESAILGTPSFYINVLKLGYLNHLEEKYKIVFNYNEKDFQVNGLAEKASQILNSEKDFKSIRDQILKDSLDTSKYIREVCK